MGNKNKNFPNKYDHIRSKIAEVQGFPCCKCWTHDQMDQLLNFLNSDIRFFRVPVIAHAVAEHLQEYRAANQRQ